MKYDELTNI